jgi:hypothetical protein
MLLRLCQLKSLPLLTLLALSSCSYFRSDKFKANELLSPMKNDWFASNPEHALHDQQGKPQPHHFFDVNPELSKNDIYVNAVVVTPEGSDHSYQLDIPSGQRYYSHSYCPQSDIWGQYSGSISKPTFSIGVIPRLLDQLGEPQKVIIFGGEKVYAKLADFHEHRIKLVGAVIEQACPEGNCLGKDNWISRMVFVAVAVENKKFENVKDIADLQKKIDWAQTKAVLENIDGRNGGGANSYPAIRMGNFIKLSEAMDYYKKRSIYLSEKESEKIRSGCQALYDKLWNDVGVEQAEDKPAKTIEELNAKVKLITELKKKRKPVGFSARLRAFTEKYYFEYTTCQKFVYAGNVNQNRDEFWFLSYMGMFYRLHKDGYYFKCSIQSWSKNNLNNVGKPTYDIKTGLHDCKDKDFDRAMDYLPNFLTGLKTNEPTFYKFVDYDTHTFGTHQKLYSWVKVKSKKYDCNGDPNPGIKKELKVFPDEVSWKTRYIKDIADELKIIY